MPPQEGRALPDSPSEMTGRHIDSGRGQLELRVAALYDPREPARARAVPRSVRGVDAIVVGGDIAAGPPQPRRSSNCCVPAERALHPWRLPTGSSPTVHGRRRPDWLLRLDDEQANWLVARCSQPCPTTRSTSTPPDDDRRRHRADDGREVARPIASREASRLPATHMQLASAARRGRCSQRGQHRMAVNRSSGVLGSPRGASSSTEYDLEPSGELVRRSTPAGRSRPRTSRSRPRERGRRVSADDTGW
jgi:hypothetical protein